MAQREASVKLTLDDGEFLVSLRKAGDESEKAGKKGAKGMSLFGAGIKGVKGQLGELSGTAGKAVGLVTGLAAGFSVAGAMKGAVELDAKFKQLAFRLSVANQQQIKSTDIQRFVEQAAAKSGRRTAELADAFDQLSSATGDMDFSSNVLESVGEAATATGQPIGTLVTLADQLHTKFGITAEQMGDAFAQVFEAAQKGGPSLEEFANVTSNLGAELLQAGMTGQRGLDFMLGSLVATDDEMKNLNAQVKGVKQVLLSLGDKAQIEAIAKTLQIDPKKLLGEKDLMARMRRILGMGKKGMEALKGSMKEAEEQKALRILFTDPFEKALAEANASGQKGKQAIDSALAVLDHGMSEFGKATINGSHIQKEAGERMKDPAKRLELALEQLERSFAKPEMIKAIEDLSQHLPKLAEALTKLISFAADNPLLAGGLFLGGQGGLGFAKGAAGEFLSSKATPLMDKLGSKSVGRMKVGNVAGGLGAVGAIAAAGLVGAEAIDNLFESDAKATGDLAAAGAAASSKRGGLSTQKAQAERLRTAIAAAEADQGGVGGFFKSAFGSVAGLVSGDKSLDMSEQRSKQIAEMKAVLAEKDARIAAMQAGGGVPGAAPAPLKVDPASQAQQGKATADALAKGAPIKVIVQNQPAPGQRMGGTGAARGASSPAPAQAGGGV